MSVISKGRDGDLVDCRSVERLSHGPNDLDSLWCFRGVIGIHNTWLSLFIREPRSVQSPLSFAKLASVVRAKF